MLRFSDIKQIENENPVIKVIGIGGGGGNAINRMIKVMNTSAVDFVAANTDLQDLRSSAATYKLQLGSQCTKGLGAGAKPQIGREAALEDIELIKEFVVGADMVFVTAGMGGGTGTGGAPVVAQIAKESKTLTVGVVTMPFAFEGKQRRRNAEKGVQELSEHVDTLIVIPNNNLLGLINPKTPMVEAFQLADDVLRQAIQGISDLITNEGIINLDFADVRTIMKDGGKAVMGAGEASGENRAISAAEKAIKSPLLSDNEITGAKGILVNMVGGPSMTMYEVNEAASFIQEQAHEDAAIIWGASINPEQEANFHITVIATGFGDEESINIPLDESKTITSSSIPPPSSLKGDESISNDTTQLETHNDVTEPSISLNTEETKLEEKLEQAQENAEETGSDVKPQLSIVPPLGQTTSSDSNGAEETENHPSTLSLETLTLSDNPESDLQEPVNSNSIIGDEDSNPEINEVNESLESDFPREDITVLETVTSSAQSSPILTENQIEEEIDAPPTVDVETSPKYPDWAWRNRNRKDFTTDLDIPTFIRRRAKKLGQDIR